MKLSISTFLLTFMVICFVLSSCESKITQKEGEVTQKFEANWDSIRDNYKIPSWFQDAKFGIFIHWGVYSVPAFGSEWYPRLMYMDTATFSAQFKPQGEGPNSVYEYHRKTWGDQKEFGYKDFVPMFKAEKFNAKEWIDLFKESGARYVVPVAEHHDGFAMYNSKFTKWNSVNKGPKRDVLAELFKEGRQQGLKMGASTHFAFNWAFFNKKEHFDTMDPAYADFYGKKGRNLKEPISEEFKKLWWNRTTDIIDNYQPDILWLDFYIDQPEFDAYHPKLAAHYYNKGVEWGKEVVLQDKNLYYTAFPEGTIVYDLERGKMKGIHKLPWQTDTSIGRNSWGHISNWESKDANSLIDDLIDIVSKKGCMLLNVGPKSDGTIPDDQAAILRDMGKWLSVNGAAIYESKVWKTFGEGPTESEDGYMSEKKKQDAFVVEDIRFTTNNGKLYAIVMDRPSDDHVIVHSLGKQSKYGQASVQGVKLLGSDATLKFEQDNKQLKIMLPDNFSGAYAFVFEIDFGEDATKIL